MKRALTHDEALDCIIAASRATTLSYQEAIESYLMLRRQEALFASADTRPQGEDALAASFTSGAVPDRADAQKPPSSKPSKE